MVLGSSSDITREVPVHSIHNDNIGCGLDSRGPADLVGKGHPAALAGNQFINRNVSGCASSPLHPRQNQLQAEMPSAMDVDQGSLLPGPLCKPCRVPVVTGSPEEAGPSTSATIPGKHRAVEMLELLMKPGNTEPGSPAEQAPSSQIPPTDDVPSGGPITICDGYNVQDSSESPPKHPELVNLNQSENETNNQAQIESQNVQVGQSTCNNYGTGPIEGMTKLVVTISGYEDLLRSRLINLISATGASYTGSLTKRNTHVVCWKFRGAKHDMAKKLGKIIVNHCWFEDCQRAGKRLPEGPYNASGEMSEPLEWDQSSMQHPSSTAVFDHDQDCDSLLSREHSLGQAVIGESSRSAKTAEYFGQSASSPRSIIGTLDRGKTVGLNSSAKRLQDCHLGTLTHDSQNNRQTMSLTRIGDSPAVDLSTPHRAQEQESDDFWNEVIRAYDKKNKHITEHSCQVFSEANNSTGLTDSRPGRPRHSASPVPGSSLRELDSRHDEIGSGSRNAAANLAEPSGHVQGEIMQRAMQPHSFIGEQADNMHSEVDHITSYPEVFQRKRKHPFEYQRWKHRRLLRKSAVSAVSSDVPNQRGHVVGIDGGIATGVQPTLDTAVTEEGATTVDPNDDCQQRAGVLDAEPVGKTGEKGGEIATGNEITCVICHSDARSITEGVLSCGHQFCYPCIQRWADEAKSKSPTCPLCKVPFDFITFREMGKVGEDGSWAVLDERIVQIGLQIPKETRFTSLPSLRTENLCVTCGSRDTQELLLICTNCRERACHTFCLDPPRPPGSSWFCSRCSQMQSRMQTRVAYGRLFHGPRSPRPRVGTAEAEMNLVRLSSRVGAMVVGQYSGTPVGMNLAPDSGSPRSVEGVNVGHSSGTPHRRRRQNSLYNFLVRQNGV